MILVWNLSIHTGIYMPLSYFLANSWPSFVKYSNTKVRQNIAWRYSQCYDTNTSSCSEHILGATRQYLIIRISRLDFNFGGESFDGMQPIMNRTYHQLSAEHHLLPSCCFFFLHKIHRPTVSKTTRNSVYLIHSLSKASSNFEGNFYFGFWISFDLLHVKAKVFCKFWAISVRNRLNT